jgi:hypothetical protein
LGIAALEKGTVKDNPVRRHVKVKILLDIIFIFTEIRFCFSPNQSNTFVRRFTSSFLIRIHSILTLRLLADYSVTIAATK